MANVPSLSNLKPPRGSRHRKVRVGRGMGSKLGKTAGAGNKGQQSRRGYSRRRGFVTPGATAYAVVNVEELNGFEKGSTVSPELLFGVGILRAKRDTVKILGDGELKVALTVQAHAFSKSAQDKITAAGGKVEVIR